MTISGFHPEDITAVSLCGTRRVFAAVQSWDMDGYGWIHGILIYILMGYSFNGVQLENPRESHVHWDKSMGMDLEGVTKTNTLIQ